jgi:hypothetical protein
VRATVLDAALVSLLAAALAGLALSVLVERWLLLPRPGWRRPWRAWAAHAGLWLLPHALLTLALGRPWFAAATVLACWLTLVLVNNAKLRTLREPFVWTDFEYFTDALRHPRLYLPFLGAGRFAVATVGFALAVAVGLWAEAPPAQRWAWSGQLGGAVALLVVGVGLLLAASRAVPAAGGVDPRRDVRALGLLGCLWRHGLQARAPLAVVSPFATLPALPVSAPSVLGPDRSGAALPDLVAVQSESFFDARAIYPGVRPELLAAYDRLKADAALHGILKVPAWGANTVRTEFAVLTGIAEAALGAHRFDPYRRVAAGWAVGSLVAWLKRLGYRAVAVHPYPASFYRRDRVYRRLGFDEFLDLRAFAGAARCGPYVSDEAVGAKVASVLAAASGPTFVYTITMENHGPLHLERATAADAAALYATPPPAGCDDLTVYLRHLRNADRMLAGLHAALASHGRPASLCWFGDHVPGLPQVYKRLKAPIRDVEYLVWNNRLNPQPGSAQARALHAHELALAWLRAAGMVGKV